MCSVISSKNIKQVFKYLSPFCITKKRLKEIASKQIKKNIAAIEYEQKDEIKK